MAIWHTDNLLGNDSTGDGSSSLPYKTIKKALDVASNSDTIKVAGSGLTSLDVSVTIPSIAGNTSLPTSSSLVGILNAGDIITLDDTTFPDNIQLFRVILVTEGSIYLNTIVPYVSGQSYNIRKLDTVHYYTTSSNVTFEAGNSNSSIDDVKILCGWVDNYTAQTGITAMVYHSSTNTSGTGFASLKGTRLMVDRIAFISLSTAFATSNQLTRYIGTTWVSGIYNPVSALEAYKYIFGGGKSVLDPGVGLRKNLYFNFISASQTFKDYAETYYLDNVYIINNQPGPNSTCFKVIANNVYSYVYSNRECLPLFGYIGKLNLSLRSYNSYSTGIVFAKSNNPSSIIKDIEYFNEPTPSIPMLLYTNGYSNYFVVFDIPTKNIDDYFYSVESSFFYGTCIIRDIEGQKKLVSSHPIFADNTVYDTGSNSLRIRSVSTDTYTPVNVKDFVGSGSSQTITIRAKASTSVSGTQLYIIDYLGFTNIAVGSVISIGTDWTDYTITYLQTEANYLSLEGLNLGVGIKPFSGTGYIWIDSVTIS